MKVLQRKEQQTKQQCTSFTFQAGCQQWRGLSGHGWLDRLGVEDDNPKSGALQNWACNVLSHNTMRDEITLE